MANSVERRSVILVLGDDGGCNGYGEAAPWPGFGTESEADALATLEEVADLMRGVDIEPDDLPPDVARRLRDAPAARAAVQGALWDLAARRAGLSLAACLAGRARAARGAALHEVQVSALLVESSPDEVRSEAIRARAEGYRAAKIKLGKLEPARGLLACAGGRARDWGPTSGCAAMRTVRGASATLARRCWRSRNSISTTSSNLSRPVMSLPWRDSEGWLRFASPPTSPSATEAGVVRLIESGAVDVFVLKPAMLGGPARALEIADRARQAGCDVVFSHAFESAVGARHALHCAAAWGDPQAIHGLCTAGLFVDDIARPVACRRASPLSPARPASVSRREPGCRPRVPRRADARRDWRSKAARNPGPSRTSPGEPGVCAAHLLALAAPGRRPDRAPDAG